MNATLMRSWLRVYSARSFPVDYVWSLYKSIQEKDTFNDVNTFCLFIGYQRSGHSLVGSLLDAHPNMVIAHELDALRYIQFGFRKLQLYHLLLRQDEEFTRSGREWTGYQYAVPNQWQGRYETLQVIGDKKGGSTSDRLRRFPHLLDRLRQMVGVNLRLVHVVRNPYDNISTMARGVSLETAMDHYFTLAETNAEIRRRVAPNEIIDVRHEALIADPQACLRELCAFLGVNSDGAYLQDCASIVFKSPRRSRTRIKWSDEQIKSVEARMAPLDFLHEYSYDS